MVTVKLKGGLGNQMFQYAAGKILGEKLSREVKIDSSFYVDKEGITSRQVDLDLFKQTNDSLFLLGKDTLFRKIIFKAKYPFLRLLRHTLVLHDIKKDEVSYYKKFKTIILDGYFHELDLLQSNRRIVNLIFKFHEGFASTYQGFLNRIQEPDSVSIHIRRGDYANQQNQSIYHICSIQYYKEAIGRMRLELNRPSFFVFSDDLKWAKEALGSENNISFIDINSEDKDRVEFFLMSSCKHHIIANSTYSWWAAYLNEHKRNFVIAPKSWYKDDMQNKKMLELMPEAWQLL